MAWPISAALESGCFDHIIVSTEDERITDLARMWGAEVPFRRPDELSGDHVTTRAVVTHAIREIEVKYEQPEFVCCLYPTAPFVEAKDLKEGLEALRKSECDFAFTVTKFSHPVHRGFRINAGKRIEMLFPEHRFTRSQDLEDIYHDAGQFYWGRAQAFLEERLMFSEAAIPIVLPCYRVQDIDTAEDWTRAELMFRGLRQMV